MVESVDLLCQDKIRKKLENLKIAKPENKIQESLNKMLERLKEALLSEK